MLLCELYPQIGLVLPRKSNWIVAAIADVACGLLCGPGWRLGSDRVDDPLGPDRRDRVVARRGRYRRALRGLRIRGITNDSRKAAL